MKKIMFNERFGLQQATFDGSKTMTRRAVKFPTKFDWGFYHYPLKPVTQEGYRAFVELLDEDEFSFEPERYVSSQYAVGEIIAIAQNYEQLVPIGEPCVIMGEYVAGKPGWLNKMFVKPEYMPHHIQITSIRVQHLQDISDDDCYKEGIYKIEYSQNGPKVAYTYKRGKISDWKETPQEAFADLIDKVSGKGTWESNPLVWVYEFKLID